MDFFCAKKNKIILINRWLGVGFEFGCLLIEFNRISI
ncbi:hypothetical protein AsAng_0001650 [Aureispira anguillae]|uniref:Uncharacterized protein n=1 Tax=Aureispira anguillae TaxID=2864201 RepID=A0A915YAD4_9BACT|nr:hypothetical protein AsAng_0001650 [Aureispira anguillae]